MRSLRARSTSCVGPEPARPADRATRDQATVRPDKGRGMSSVRIYVDTGKAVSTPPKDPESAHSAIVSPRGLAQTHGWGRPFATCCSFPETVSQMAFKHALGFDMCVSLRMRVDLLPWRCTDGVGRPSTGRLFGGSCRFASENGHRAP
jgi:hypothetical protein